MSDKRVKGCPNSNCKAYKKIKYKATDEYCTQCSSPLVFVCAKCWSPLAKDDKKVRICGVCEAKAEDRKKKMIENAGKALKMVPVAAVAIAKATPKAAKAVSKVAPIVAKVIKK